MWECLINDLDIHNRLGMKIKEYYEGKRILITGTTGFLGKVVLEKLLWEVPGLEKVILLIRPGKGQALTQEAATSRFKNCIASSRLFDRLRDREPDFEDYLKEKIDCFPCDLAEEGLGISDPYRKEICDGLDAIIHVAAEVSWQERVDRSIKINTLATKQLLDCAKSVTPHPHFIYISSAYVNGFRSGTVREQLFDPEKSIANELGGKVPFSIENEIEFALANSKIVDAESHSTDLYESFKEEAEQQRLAGNKIDVSLKDQIETIRQNHVRSQLSDAGMKQANLHGWTDTYTFSKAMAEMLLVKHQENVPIAIIRPPGITSAVKEPAKGWLEGFHLVEPLIVGMGKGLIKAFPGLESSLIDTVPVDYVVNLTLSACATLEEGTEPSVFQIGTSQTNPIDLASISTIWRSYFNKNPLTNDAGKLVSVPPIKFFNCPKAFNQKIQRRYLYPLNLAQVLLKGTKFAGKSKSYQKAVYWVAKSKKRVQRICQFSDLYSAYTMNSWVFSSENTMGLFRRLSNKDQQAFDFDTTKIDWKSYWQETHIPGMKKYVLKDNP